MLPATFLFSLNKSLLLWVAGILSFMRTNFRWKMLINQPRALSCVLLHPPAASPFTLLFSPKCIFSSYSPYGCQMYLILQLKEKILYTMMTHVQCNQKEVCLGYMCAILYAPAVCVCTCAVLRNYTLFISEL